MNDGETEVLWHAWGGVSAGGVAMTPVGGADPAAGPGEGPQAVRPGRGAA